LKQFWGKNETSRVVNVKRTDDFKASFDRKDSDDHIEIIVERFGS
jgi:hypothetical protein